MASGPLGDALVLSPDERHAVGLDSSRLRTFGDHLLLPSAGEAFERLAAEAAAAGFDLRIASAYRGFERQRHIWNGKLCGRRPVVDDRGEPVELERLPARGQIESVLRFSALPGASRHHWGTDLDVFDGAAVPADYRLRLDGAEVADSGVFGPLHRWLDERIATGESHGFYRPYDRDRGGVAPERWHLSFAPGAAPFSGVLSCDLLRRTWDEQAETGVAVASSGAGREAGGLLLRTQLDDCLEELFERFVSRVAVPGEAATGYAASA